MLTLWDVLRDSIANFHTHQKELEWTALAYALYLPPVREWTNRFGERATFDDLVEELLARELRTSSCCGTHVVYTLTILARVDQQIPVLGATARQRLWQRLRDVIQVVRASQAADGGWSADWYRRLTPQLEPPPVNARPDQPNIRLTATGHLAEWLLYVPEELDVPQSSVLRAGRWLYDMVRDPPPAVIANQFCPYSHAVCVLRHLVNCGDGGRSEGGVERRP
jgi:hypothetical protein